MKQSTQFKQAFDAVHLQIVCAILTWVNVLNAPVSFTQGGVLLDEFINEQEADINERPFITALTPEGTLTVEDLDESYTLALSTLPTAVALRLLEALETKQYQVLSC